MFEIALKHKKKRLRIQDMLLLYRNVKNCSALFKLIYVLVFINYISVDI